MLITSELRDSISAMLKHLDHVLPGQAPILDFVHHNTLHGFQHLPFEEALAAFETLTGINGYLPEVKSREYYKQGRINDRDIAAAFSKTPTLQAQPPVCVINNQPIDKGSLYSLLLHYDFKALTPSQLQWQIAELKALEKVQTDIPSSIKSTICRNAPENLAVNTLWHMLLNTLELDPTERHPEDLMTLAQEQASHIPTDAGDHFDAALTQQTVHAQQALTELFTNVGQKITLRGLVKALSGIDILDSVRPLLIRSCASVMDEGLAPWPMPMRHQGLYAAWKATAHFDAQLLLQKGFDWQAIMAALPDTALETIIVHLTALDIPQSAWAGYCQRLALEIPGWSGLINWREHRPDYAANTEVPLTLADYLAIRLTLDHLWLNQVCHDLWKLDAKLTRLQRYFSKNLTEFKVRHALYQGDLPEYLTQKISLAISETHTDWQSQTNWAHFADLISTWKATTHPNTINVCNHGWRLFRLIQHLGLCSEDIQALQKDDLLGLLSVVDAFNHTERAKVWLLAYENHYQQAFFQALQANHNRGRWAKRDNRPEAQLIFCMDDREEGFRRHLEELNPALETLGAAGFFGVPMNYKGLDDSHTTPLCPIVVTPINEVQEQPRAGHEAAFQRHQKGRKLLFTAIKSVQQRLRSNLLLAPPLINTIAPLTLANLLAKAFFPKAQQHLISSIQQRLSVPVTTELRFNAAESQQDATLTHPQLGFTDNEQVTRVAGFLRNTGLTYGFSPLVILFGHGSMSQNNPHLAAYDCGACSGRHGGPNARVFAAMANRPVIRQLLADRGILIPADTWFIGAEHNTCDEAIIGYDLEDLPEQLRPAWQKLQLELQHAQRLSAHERCRRLASAPRNPSPKQALQHIAARATDYSQARPELGHATNASALIGRRSLTQGAFFDRRVFLISYDPSQDPHGTILEGILLAVGPVGAGINLEYYFSTVNNERFGCGSKIPHNVTGFFGVMEGTSSDLRTGLPQQMIEIHEAMRLQIIVEAKTNVLERIYGEQESLRELISGGWVHLSAKDPDTGEIFSFERGIGFVKWQAAPDSLPLFENSTACYQGQTLPVAPVLIQQPNL